MKAKFSLFAAGLNFAVAAFNGITAPSPIAKAIFIAINGTAGLLCFYLFLKRNRS